MPRKTIFTVDEYYHVYNRGVDKRTIFQEPNDYARFFAALIACNDANDSVKPLKRLCMKPSNGPTCVDIIAFCLMPNHFHLLLRQRTEIKISKFMHRIGVSYTKYFNQKYSRSGSLFEGPFQAKHINRDTYLWQLINYIHMNPLELMLKSAKEVRNADAKDILRLLGKYKWSSFPSYLYGNFET